MMRARRLSASVLALSLELATMLGLYQPANDNGRVDPPKRERRQP
jgi:hypothetical protein